MFAYLVPIEISGQKDALALAARLRFNDKSLGLSIVKLFLELLNICRK